MPLSRCLDLRNDGGALGLAAGREHDPRARPGENERRGPPDARGPARDDRYAPVQHGAHLRGRRATATAAAVVAVGTARPLGYLVLATARIPPLAERAKGTVSRPRCTAPYYDTCRVLYIGLRTLQSLSVGTTRISITPREGPPILLGPCWEACRLTGICRYTLDLQLSK